MVYSPSRLASSIAAAGLPERCALGIVSSAPLKRSTELEQHSGLKESSSDMIDIVSVRLERFPKFDQCELTMGTCLGRGTHNNVYELEGIKLCQNKNNLNAARTDSWRPCYWSESSRSSEGFDSLTSSFGSVSEVDEIQRSFVSKTCTRANGAHRYAIKSLSTRTKLKEHTDKKAFQHATQDLYVEARFLASIEHPHIVKLRGLSRESMGSPSFFLVLDRLSCTLADEIACWRIIQKKAGELRARVAQLLWIKKRQTKDLIVERIKVARDISSAIAHLHGKKIMHRDLKPENIGFDFRGDVRVFDLGLAKEFVASQSSNFSEKQRHTGRVGTKRYMAPENYRCLSYNESIDIHSLGIITWEMLHLETPFASMDETQYAALVVKRGLRPEIHSKLDPALKDLMDACWLEEDQNRPSARELYGRLTKILNQMTDGKATWNTESAASRRRSTFEQDRFLS